MPTPRVIDLSHHNTIPSSLKPARESGVWGVIHKATEGTSFVDDALDARAHLAREAGMLFGTYHFLRPGSIEKQADFYIATITPILDSRHLVACDFEVDGISLADARKFIDRVELLAARTCVLYSGHSLKDAIKAGQDPGNLTSCRLWLAQYGSKATLPKGWSSYFLWQYSDAAAVPGVTPPTDVNHYGGSLELLEEEWSGRGYTPLPEPAPVPALVGITVRGDVEIVINGKIVYPPEAT